MRTRLRSLTTREYAYAPYPTQKRVTPVRAIHCLLSEKGLPNCTEKGASPPNFRVDDQNREGSTTTKFQVEKAPSPFRFEDQDKMQQVTHLR